jgi:hypothetical protein
MRRLAVARGNRDESTIFDQWQITSPVIRCARSPIRRLMDFRPQPNRIKKHFPGFAIIPDVLDRTSTIP